MHHWKFETGFVLHYSVLEFGVCTLGWDFNSLNYLNFWRAELQLNMLIEVGISANLISLILPLINLLISSYLQFFFSRWFYWIVDMLLYDFISFMLPWWCQMFTAVRYTVANSAYENCISSFDCLCFFFSCFNFMPRVFSFCQVVPMCKKTLTTLLPSLGIC